MAGRQMYPTRAGSVETATGYRPALDGLRGLAAIAVLAFHSKMPFLPGGFLGVDLFFVLSGFLITGLLRAEAHSTGTIDIMRFYWRRALRLWPPLIATLVVYVILVRSAGVDENWQADVLLSMFYLTDYSYSIWRLPELLRHTWSLSVEEHFYLVWPLVILLTRRIDGRSLALVLGCAYVLATGWRMLDFVLFDDWRWTYFRLDTRLSGLLLGAILYLIPWRPRGAVLGWAGLALLAVLAATLKLPSWPQFAYGAIAAEFAAAAVVACAASSRDNLYTRILSWPPLVFCGLLSYTLYLVHYPIVRLLRADLDPYTTFAIAASGSFLFAWAVRVLIEKPVRRWRDGGVTPYAASPKPAE